MNNIVLYRTDFSFVLMEYKHRMEYRVKDIKLADIGKKRIDWAESHMPVLNA
jgi:hypothetical protein